MQSALESFIDKAKGIKEMADQLDMTTDATQKWAKSADEAHQSLEAVYNVLSAIQSKRQEALRDPKAADLFSGLGISREQVLHENNSDFARDVLKAGDNGNDSRALLEQIVGRRGLKVSSVASGYDAAKPDFGNDEFQAADAADKGLKRAGSAVGRVFGHLFGWVFNAVDDSAKRARQDQKDIALGDKKGGLLWRFLHRHEGEEVEREHVEGVIHKMFPVATPKPIAPKPTTDDPLINIEAQQQKEFELRKEEAEFGLHEVQRHNMTIAARKASIKEDLALVNKEIDARKKAQKAGLIYGMTPEQQKNLLPTDIKEKLQNDTLSLLGLQSKSAGLTGELHDSRGFNFSADSMARVGLYSAQTAGISPLLTLNEKQLIALEKIEYNTNTARLGQSPHDR